MLIRICLIVAIVTGLAAGALNFTKVKEKIVNLQAERDTEHNGRVTAETDLAKTRNDLDATSKELKATKTTLESTTEERDRAVAEADKRIKEAEALSTDLKRVTGERDTAQESLAAYKATGQTPQQIIASREQIKQLRSNLEVSQTDNRILGQKLTRVQAELDRYINPDKPIPLPANLRGKILVMDPKFNFVVLDIGENQGVVMNGELLVNRNGKLISKVIVRNVQKDRCVANVVTGWDISELMEGDQVIPAHPAS